MVRVCPKCGYERKADEPVPETECPQCGAIYAKIEQALRKAEEPERKILILRNRNLIRTNLHQPKKNAPS